MTEPTDADRVLARKWLIEHIEKSMDPKVDSLARMFALLRERIGEDEATRRMAKRIDRLVADTVGMRELTEALQAKLQTLVAASPEDLRAEGWMVQFHADVDPIASNGVPETSWILRRGTAFAYGRGKTDAEALAMARTQTTRVGDEPEDEEGC